MNTDYLYQSWEQLNKRSAAGIDGIKPDAYQQQLHRNILSLSEQLKHKSYRASGIKRVFIPKANGKQRPLGLTTIDDKVVQQGAAKYCKAFGSRIFCLTARVIDRTRALTRRASV